MSRLASPKEPKQRHKAGMGKKKLQKLAIVLRKEKYTRIHRNENASTKKKKKKKIAYKSDNTPRKNQKYIGEGIETLKIPKQGQAIRTKLAIPK